MKILSASFEPSGEACERWIAGSKGVQECEWDGVTLEWSLRSTCLECVAWWDGKIGWVRDA